MVLPKPQDTPAFSAERGRHLSVACLVSKELGNPVILIRCRLAAVFRAAVPKTPIYKNGQPF